MKQPSSSSLADYIYCSSCGKKYELMEIHNESLCCRQPLLLHYAGKFQKGSLPGRNNTMWRYEEMLPVKHRENIISLGEGMTPITGLKTIAADYAFSQPILVKDESYN